MHVRKVLERLRKAGLQADVKKCEFGVTRTKYLGFIVSTSGIEVDQAKISVGYSRLGRAPIGARGTFLFGFLRILSSFY